jgi:bacterioferritin
MPQFVKDVEELRQRAIHKIEDGPVTESYGVDKERAIAVLNQALATEIVCVLRYMHHYFMATGVHGKGVADEFKEHADAEREHADKIGERIQQLGGKPDFNPGSLVQRSVSQYVEGESLAGMIREDLIAERVVIEVYTEMIRFFGEKDPTTRRLIEDILEDEEEHAADLTDLLFVVDPRTGQAEGEDPGTEPLLLREELAPAQAREPFQGGRMERTGTGERRTAAGQDSGMTIREAAATRGRATRKGNDEIEEEAGDVRAGAETGTSRSVHVTNPNRKRKKVA